MFPFNKFVLVALVALALGVGVAVAAGTGGGSDDPAGVSVGTVAGTVTSERSIAPTLLHRTIITRK